MDFRGGVDSLYLYYGRRNVYGGGVVFFDIGLLLLWWAGSLSLPVAVLTSAHTSKRRAKT